MQKATQTKNTINFNENIKLQSRIGLSGNGMDYDDASSLHLKTSTSHPSFGRYGLFSTLGDHFLLPRTRHHAHCQTVPLGGLSGEQIPPYDCLAIVQMDLQGLA